MVTARVIVRLKPRSRLTDGSVQSVTGETPTLLVKKGDNDDNLFQFSFTEILACADQTQTYESCGRDIVGATLKGYNGTIMAYGQTGAGKTYTMIGAPEVGTDPNGDRRGIVPRALDQLFAGLTRSSLLHFRVRVSCLEIHNEAFRDLMRPETPSSDLTITDSKGVIGVRNLTCTECSTAADAESLVSKALARRQAAEHNLNSDSSRSHVVVSIRLEAVDKEGTSLTSKLNLVDLAGSERLGKTGTQGATAREALHINKSLTFLEQTVIALARKQQYVPFRSSKLTHFLKDSIGGNCKTLLVACAWPDAEQVSETLSTCRFAQRMLQVAEDARPNAGGLSSVHGNLFRLDPVVQRYLENMTAAAVAREKAQLYAEFARLKAQQTPGMAAAEAKELEQLRIRVRELELQGADSPAEPISSPPAADADTLAEMEALRGQVRQLERDVVAAREASPLAGGPMAAASAPRIAHDRTSAAPENTEEGSSSSEARQSAAALAEPDLPHAARSAPMAGVSAAEKPRWPAGAGSSLGFSSFSGSASDDEGAADTLGPARQQLPPVDASVVIRATPGDASGLDTCKSPEPIEVRVDAQCEVSCAAEGADGGHLLIPSYSSSAAGGSDEAAPIVEDILPHEIRSSEGAPKLSQPPRGSAAPAHSSLPPFDAEVPPPPSYVSGWDQDLTGFNDGMLTGRERQRRRGFFSKLFKRRSGEEHESFSAFGPPEPLDDEPATPNIVILNSLNHNQLLELLKARPLRHVMATPAQSRENRGPASLESPCAAQPPERPDSSQQDSLAAQRERES